MLCCVCSSGCISAVSLGKQSSLETVVFFTLLKLSADFDLVWCFKQRYSIYWFPLNKAVLWLNHSAVLHLWSPVAFGIFSQCLLHIVLCVSCISTSPLVFCFIDYISLLLLLIDTVGFPRTLFLQTLPDSSRAAFLRVTSATGVSGATQGDRFYSMWITVAEIGPKFRMSSKGFSVQVQWWAFGCYSWFFVCCFQ